LDDEEEKIILCGPKYVGKWTCAQAGQAEFSGISQPGMDRSTSFVWRPRLDAQPKD